MKRLILTLSLSLMAAATAVHLSAAETSPADSGVQSELVAPDAPKVRVSQGSVEIEVPSDQPADVTVYAITGRIVTRFSAAPGISRVDLRPGCYIVRVDGRSTRVVVR